MVSMPEPVIKMIKQSDTHKVLARYPLTESPT